MWPRPVKVATSSEPMRPVPPITTIFILVVLSWLKLAKARRAAAHAPLVVSLGPQAPDGAPASSRGRAGPVPAEPCAPTVGWPAEAEAPGATKATYTKDLEGPAVGMARCSHGCVDLTTLLDRRNADVSGLRYHDAAFPPADIERPR